MDVSEPRLLPWVSPVTTEVENLALNHFLLGAGPWVRSQTFLRHCNAVRLGGAEREFNDLFCSFCLKFLAGDSVDVLRSLLLPNSTSFQVPSAIRSLPKLGSCFYECLLRLVFADRVQRCLPVERLVICLGLCDRIERQLLLLQGCIIGPIRTLLLYF